jgi:hypothetical protein
MMQAFANREAVKLTLQTGKARVKPFAPKLLLKKSALGTGHLLDALATAPVD